VVDPSKDERLREFFRRLKEAPPTSTYEKARSQLADILNTVEDELTSIVYNPMAWQTDGRMYPPLDDSVREVQRFPRVRRLRSRAHNTYIGENGAIEIRQVPTDIIEVSKPGTDGREIRDLLAEA